MLAKFIAILMLLLTCTGCSNADYVENQAYAVMLGIDYDGGSYELTVKYPALAGSSGGQQSGGSGYGVISAKGQHVQQAMDELRYSVPREINLSALTMIVVSEQTAASGKLADILDVLSDSYRMYSSAYLAVCEGKANEFVTAQEPVIGSRLSEGLKALVGNAQQMGIIPASRYADVYYRMKSVYSEPMVMGCSVKKGEENQSKPEDGGSSEKPADECVYEGAYLLDNGKIACRLTDSQTILTNLITGDIKKFTYSKAGDSAFISVDEKPVIKVSTGDKPEISLLFKLSAMKVSGEYDMQQLAGMLQNDIADVIETCRKTGSEPFGFADRAAASFKTMEQWNKYNWPEKFINCKISIEIELREIFSND